MLNSLPFIFFVIYLNFPQKIFCDFFCQISHFAVFIIMCMCVCMKGAHTYNSSCVGVRGQLGEVSFPLLPLRGFQRSNADQAFSPWTVRALWLPGSHCSGRGLVRILHCYSLYDTLRMWLLRLKVRMATSGRLSGPQKSLLGVSHQLRDPLQIFRK